MSDHIHISRRLLLVNFASVAARRLVSASVMFWLYQKLVRTIDPSEYQLYPVLVSVMVFFEMAMPVFASGLRQHVTAAYAQGNMGQVTRLVSTMAPVLAAGSLFVLALGGVIAWNIDAVLSIAPNLVADAQLMLALLVLDAALQLVQLPYGMGFHIRQKFLLRNLIGLGIELFRVTLLLVLLHTLGTHVRWVVVAMVTANVTELVVDTIISRRLVPWLRYRSGAFSRELLRPLISFGFWAVLGRISTLVRDAADNLILNRMATPIAVTAFHQGSLVDTGFRETFLRASSTAQPVVTAMRATGQVERLRRTYFAACRYALLVMLGVAVPFILFRHEFFQLYLGDRYQELSAAATVMGLILARILFIFPNSILGMLSVATREMRAVAWRSSLISVVHVALSVYLVGVAGMGAVGSAIGAFLSAAIGTPLLQWTLGLRLIDARFVDWMRKSVWPGILPALAAFPFWVGANAICPADTWFALVVDFAAGGSVYAVIAFLYGLEPIDRALVATALGRLRAAAIPATPSQKNRRDGAADAKRVPR